MIYTKLTREAMKVAYSAHHGQTDKAGVPYIFHPAHVAESMTDEVLTCVALLHDVVEDTDVTLEDLVQKFPPEVIEPLRLLTRQRGIDYLDYVRAIKTNPIATKVKLADLAHNADVSRISGCTDVLPEKIEHLQARYAQARAILES